MKKLKPDTSLPTVINSLNDLIDRVNLILASDIKSTVAEIGDDPDAEPWSDEDIEKAERFHQDHVYYPPAPECGPGESVVQRRHHSGGVHKFDPDLILSNEFTMKSFRSVSEMPIDDPELTRVDSLADEYIDICKSRSKPFNTDDKPLIFSTPGAGRIWPSVDAEGGEGGVAVDFKQRGVAGSLIPDKQALFYENAVLKEQNNILKHGRDQRVTDLSDQLTELQQFMRMYLDYNGFNEVDRPMLERLGVISGDDDA